MSIIILREITYYLQSPDLLADFDTELRSKGLDPIYDVKTDEAAYKSVVGPVEGMKKISLTFLIVVLILGAVILILLSSIGIRERKYEIGVLRAMGMKKGKVALGLWSEMIFITLFCLMYIGVVFQSFNLITNATAIENIVLSMHISKVSRKDKRAYAYALLESVSLVMDISVVCKGSCAVSLQ